MFGKTGLSAHYTNGLTPSRGVCAALRYGPRRVAARTRWASRGAVRTAAAGSARPAYGRVRAAGRQRPGGLPASALVRVPIARSGKRQDEWSGAVHLRDPGVHGPGRHVAGPHAVGAD